MLTCINYVHWLYLWTANPRKKRNHPLLLNNLPKNHRYFSPVSLHHYIFCQNLYKLSPVDKSLPPWEKIFYFTNHFWTYTLNSSLSTRPTTSPPSRSCRCPKEEECTSPETHRTTKSGRGTALSAGTTIPRPVRDDWHPRNPKGETQGPMGEGKHKVSDKNLTHVTLTKSK